MVLDDESVDGPRFVFSSCFNKRRRLAKSLWFDGSGWCLLAERLEAGSFQLPPFDGDQPQVAIDGSAFASLLAGIDFTAARRGWYRRPQKEKVTKTIDTDLQV
jgi:transposase